MLCFHVKFVHTDKWMDGQMDGRTTVKQYALDLLMQGHRKNQ